METIKLRAKVTGSGKPGDPFRVDLPTYQMIPGSEEYGPGPDHILKSVEVMVPADECDSKGRLSKSKIRAKYKGQKRWDRAGVLSDV